MSIIETSNLMEVSNLRAHYFSPRGVVKAVDGISFNLRKGERLGIAGESGCGKTTCAKALMRLIRPSRGTLDGKIIFAGEDLLQKSEREMRAIRWKRISMVFQAAMNALNPVMRVKDQIGEAISIHDRLEKDDIIRRVEELLAMVGINPSRGNDYPHEFSGGQKQRAVIAMALACNPDIVILDEPTTALDVVIQAQILKLLHDLSVKINSSMILITHDISIISEICDRIAIFYAGKIVELTNLESFFRHPIHPYSQCLIGAFPKIQSSRTSLVTVPGSPPDLTRPPPGCRFSPRCPLRENRCSIEEPSMKEARKNHYVACHSADSALD